MLFERVCSLRRPFRLALLSLAAGVLVAAAGLADSGPTVTGQVPVNDPQQLFPLDNPTRATSSIARSVDGRNLLVAFEDLQGLCGVPGGLACPAKNPPGLSAFSFSTDGGATWTDSGFPFAIGNVITAGHPWVDRLDRPDAAETFFMVSRMQGATNGAPTGGIGIYRGHFGAGTFVWDDGQVINSANGNNEEYSRPAVATARDGVSAYVALINVDEICARPFSGYGQVEAWRTHDGGDSWQGPVIVSPDAADVKDPSLPHCGRHGFQQVAPAVTTGPGGEVYVVWAFGPEFFLDTGTNTPFDSIGFAASFDGGQTFTAPAKIAFINAMRDNPPVGYAKNRMNDQPRIAVATGGPHRGRIYVGFYSAVSPVTGVPTVQSLVSSQSYVIHSDDGGQTWSAPVPIGPPVPPTGVKRFWPTLSTRPNGDLDVVYLESQEVPTGTPCHVDVLPGRVARVGAASSLVDLFWIQSRDGGDTFSAPFRVTSQTSNWCTAPYSFSSPLTTDSFLLSNAGDYIGSTSSGESTLVVWPDDRNVFMDTFFAEIRGWGSHPGGSGKD